MDNVDHPLRFVNFVMKYPDKKRSQIMIATTCMDVNLKTLFKTIKTRWDVENCTFNNQKNECNLRR